MKLSFNVWKAWAVLSLILFFGMFCCALTVGIEVVKEYEYVIYLVLFNLAASIIYGVKNHND
jgi:hypothetical protein